MSSLRVRHEDDTFAHFEDYAHALGTGGVDGRTLALIRAPETKFDQIPAKTLVEEYSARNPLMKLNRRFPVPKMGSIASYKSSGMKWTPNEKEIENFLRSARSQNDFHALKKAVGPNKEVQRAGSAEHGIIFDLKKLGSSNSLPFGLEVRINSVRGNSYALNGIRGVSYLPPNSVYEAPDTIAQTVHTIDPRIDVYEAHLFDSISEADLRNEVIDIPGEPNMKLLRVSEDSHIVRLLANEKNGDVLLRRFNFNQKEKTIDTVSGVGELMGCEAGPIELCIEGWLQAKADNKDLVSRCDFHELKVEFIPISSKPHVTWANIEEHEVFDGMSKEERDKIINNPLQHVHIELGATYIFKDEILRAKLFDEKN